MKTLDNLIDALADEGTSLSDSLLKTKVLLYKIGTPELTQWVNDELNGYASDNVPAYRRITARVVGTLQTPRERVTNFQMPLQHLDEDFQEKLSHHLLTQPMKVLQELASQNTTLTVNLPAEAGEIFASGFDGFVQVIETRKIISSNQIAGALAQVRSRLLDFLLQLREQIGSLSDAEVTPQATEGVDTQGIFNRSVFGDGTTIIVGSHNIQTVNSNNAPGDLEALLALLSKKKIENAELDELRSAIATDPRPVSKKQLGPAVSSWIGRQLSRAASAAWDVEISIAAGLLTTALQNYYGL